MVTLVPSVAAVAVSAIYCLWQAYHREQVQRQRTLHQRVAYMLWMAANVDEDVRSDDQSLVGCQP